MQVMNVEDLFKKLVLVIVMCFLNFGLEDLWDLYGDLQCFLFRECGV